MASKVTMLDTALVLAQHELDALTEGDVDRAAGHLETRMLILEKAYVEHDEESNEMYIMKLQALTGMNESIKETGEALKESIRKSLKGINKSVNAANKYLQASKDDDYN